jgi:hypothetical protein
MNFFGDGSPTNNFTPLEHKRFQTSLCQVAGSNQPIVPAADNDDVVR